MAGSSPENPSSGNCFSGLLTLILCSKSLPTHPSDQLPGAYSHSLPADHQSSVKSHHRPDSKAAPATTATTTPGVVARLMGLESMPDSSSPGSRSFGSYLRSRSVNFLDYFPQIDLTGEAQHRRVRTSPSFREADFVVLCIESRDAAVPGEEVAPLVPHTAAPSFRDVKTNYKAEKTEQKVNVVKKNSAEKVISPPAKKRNASNVNINRKGNFALNKKKRAVKKSVGESIAVSAESKTNGNAKNIKGGSSILDNHCQSSLTKSDKSGKLQKRSKKELHKPSYAVHHHTRRKADKAFITDKASKATEGNVSGPRKKDFCDGSSENGVEEIYRLAADFAAEFWWICGGIFKFKDLEEFCMHFSKQILDVLLDDVVFELKYLTIVKSRK
ncbi:unnamed protein product [Cuscuta epithymum]|uniref:DUF3741 domain-containing protein n=1 Tax=Cuscuta epithymum TaxID=186058 RepID=A0AAV0G2D9_9ASTE|nr:unnamed protein product [Cuscuta epithymum]CAH9142031.1 unnamed protein product [Cuscuta epithymum]